jgi:hypothetical protein
VTWPALYRSEDSAEWFNPWPIKYLLPVAKWFPLTWPNEEWEIQSFPPEFDALGNKVGPQPPDGAIGPWWKMLPKDEWPVAAPWEPKVLGAWPASKVTMSEDLAPSIWPGGHRAPPFGFIKLAMPGEPAIKDHQIAFMHMKIHMRPDFGPIHHLRIMTRNTPMGQKFFLIDKNWDYAEYHYNGYRAALKARRMEKYMEQLALEIAKYDGKPKQPKDLFV